MAMITFDGDDKMKEILENGGTYYTMPIYDEPINAYEWNSFCMGSNLRDRYIFLVRNGKTQFNMSQPKVWADANYGLDTDAVGTYKVVSQTIW